MAAVRYPSSLCGATHTLLLLLLFLFLTVCVPRSSAHTNPAKPSWSKDCESPFTHCSVVESHESWSSETGRVTFSVFARFVDYKEGTTVWYVGDQYDNKIGQLTADAKVNVVWFRPRGTGQGTPLVQCHRTHLDRFCNPTDRCMKNMSAINAEHFSLEETAKDLDWAIRSLNQAGKPVILLGQGFSSAVVMRYMRQHVNSTAVASILVDPVHPALYNHFTGLWEGYDAAMQTLLRYCDATTRCSAQLGAVEGAWERLQNVLSAAKQSHLPCQAQLGWGTGEEFAKNIRHQLASMLLPTLNSFTPTDMGLLSLIPAFLYRLQRCSDKDVVALRTLRNKTLEVKIDNCPADAVLQSLWLVNEFTPDSYRNGGSPPSAKRLLESAHNTRSVIPVDDALNSFASFYAAAPKHKRKEKEGDIAFTRTKILVIHSDMDPLLQLPPANALSLTYRDVSTKFHHPVFRAAHLPGSTSLYQCLKNVVDEYRTSSEWSKTNSCYQSPSEAHDGINFFGGNPSLFFGEKDAWDFTIANAPEPPEGRLHPESRAGAFWRVVKRILWALFWLAAIAGVVVLGYMAYTRWNFNRVHISDNFYDNLHR